MGVEPFKGSESPEDSPLKLRQENFHFKTPLEDLPFLPAFKEGLPLKTLSKKSCISRSVKKLCCSKLRQEDCVLKLRQENLPFKAQSVFFLQHHCTGRLVTESIAEDVSFKSKKICFLLLYQEALLFKAPGRRFAF